MKNKKVYVLFQIDTFDCEDIEKMYYSELEAYRDLNKIADRENYDDIQKSLYLDVREFEIEGVGE